MTRLALIAPMLVFGFAGIYFLVLFLQPGNENRVYDNLVPCGKFSATSTSACWVRLPNRPRPAPSRKTRSW